MVSLGLDFMYGHAEGGESKRSELIRSNHPVAREFLLEALQSSPRLTTGHEHDAPRVKENEDDPSRSNLGYRLFVENSNDATYIRISDSGCKYTPLRQLGYVFWDMARIQSAEVPEKLLAAESMGWDEIHERFDRRKRKSAEERLKGTKLPTEVLERMNREFGSTLFLER
ncbi:hypothetical protein QQX98_002345 [Neonectria punicea]|uniref:Uncharacterized protein n=1 Tax=Neonectria punicea TaxID=979145 RepID=A0ABR1HJ47_9HYPO